MLCWRIGQTCKGLQMTCKWLEKSVFLVTSHVLLYLTRLQDHSKSNLIHWILPTREMQIVVVLVFLLLLQLITHTALRKTKFGEKVLKGRCPARFPTAPTSHTDTDFWVQVCSVYQELEDSDSLGRPPLLPGLRWYFTSSNWPNTPDPANQQGEGQV